MEEIFAPWRINWVRRETETPDGCIFCIFSEDEDGGDWGGDDEDNLVVARGTHTYVMLNRHPYNPGHAMVVPDHHTGRYDELTDEELELVARHGEGTYARALALTRLAKRKGRFDELLGDTDEPEAKA